jgi:hypothetical protein
MIYVKHYVKILLTTRKGNKLYTRLPDKSTSLNVDEKLIIKIYNKFM